MRSNKLYTVNKWNKPAFMGDRIHQNIFDGLNLTPNQMQQLKLQNMSTNPGFMKDAHSALSNSILSTPDLSNNTLSALPNTTGAVTGSGGIGGLFSGLGDKIGGVMGGGKLAGTPMGGLVSGLGSAVGSIGGGLIGGGLQSGAGSAISNIGGALGSAVGTVNPVLGAAVSAASGIIGGLTNRAFGSKLNEEKIAEIEAAQQKRQEENNALYSAKDTNSLTELAGNLSTANNFSAGDIGEDGWFASDAEDKYNQLKAEEERVSKLQELALANATDNVNENNFLNSAKQFRYGLGGRLFADGGLQSAFMDEFGSDPIGAAMRYKQGLERQEAEKEEAAMNAAREAEYLANQQRLANLETQYQGLQALVSAMPSSNYAEEPSTSSSPSRAAYNSNWDYIEDQLKRSGKFNDIQIQGIKYNLQRESGIGKYDGGDNGTARGLAQWRGDRIPEDMSLEGQTRHLIDTLSNYDGKLHWIGEDNYRGFMNARTPEEAHYYIARGYERPHRDIIAKVKRDSDMSLRNLHAFGGELGTNGADFTDGMIYIDAGGSHEDNPLDGVPMGVDAEGIPNLVEEGETVYNDYVFSDRMKVPTFMYKELGLGGVIKKKGKGMSFADASKKLSQESEQRPNDPISKAGLDAALSRLAEVQETERMKQNAEEYMGLAEYALGGQLGHQYDYGGALKWLREKHPEVGNKEQIAKALSKRAKKIGTMTKTGEAVYDYKSAYNDMVAPNKPISKDNDALFESLVRDGMERRAAFGLAYPQTLDYPYSGDRYKSGHDAARNAAYKKYITDYKAPTTKEKKEIAAAASTVSEDSLGLTPQTVAPGTIKEYSQDAKPQSTSTPKPEAKAQRTGNRGQAVPGGSSNKPYGGIHAEEENTPEQIARMEAARKGVMPDLGPELSLTEVAERTAPTENEGLPVEATTPEQGIMVTNPNTSKEDPYPTWMRYAPVFGNGLMTLTDALGITNKPDYTYADKIEGYARQAGNAPHVSYKPSSNYLRYNPMDIWFGQNRMDANARATDRAIMNNAAPIGTKMAGLLASGYNNQIADGQLYRNALEYNDAKRKDVAGFNRTTDMFNSQMGLEAAMANARYSQAAKQMGLSGLAQAASMRDAIDQRVGAARSANLTNFLTSLGNIGRENFAMNQINDDAAYNYGVRANGTTPFKRSGACGGKIKRRK